MSAVAVAAVGAIMLLVPSVVAAQSVIDQYVPNPDPTGRGPIPGIDPAAGGAGGADGAKTGKDDPKAAKEDGRATVNHSTLPGSDFPSVPLVTIVLIALGLGLALWVLRWTSTREAH